MLYDDMLEMKSLNTFQFKKEQFSVKFHRTVQRPYTQSIIISYFHPSTKDRAAYTSTDTVEAQAIIMELSYNKVVFKVDVFDTEKEVYKLFFQSEFTLDESNQKILNKERFSNIVQIGHQNAILCNAQNYHEYEIVTEYGYCT